MADCIFCRIVSGEIPAQKLVENDFVIAFRDLAPVAPVHFLVIPKKHIVNLAELDEGDAAILGEVLAACSVVAREQGIDDDGFRVVVNTNAAAGQSVFHLHAHVLGGRDMAWPPG